MAQGKGFSQSQGVNFPIRRYTTMSAWPDRLEHFLDHYPRIIAAVEAISTFAAVVVALYLARRSETLRLRALLSIGLSPANPTRLAILQISNIGVRAGALAPPPFFEWRIPFRRKHQPETMFSPINTAYSINRDKITSEITVGSPMTLQVTDLDTWPPFLALSQKLRTTQPSTGGVPRGRRSEACDSTMF